MKVLGYLRASSMYKKTLLQHAATSDEYDLFSIVIEVSKVLSYTKVIFR